MNQEKIREMVILSDFLITRRNFQLSWEKDYLERKKIKFEKFFEKIDRYLDKKAFYGFLSDYLHIVINFDNLFENSKIKEKEIEAKKNGEFLLEENIVDEFEILISQEEINFIKKTKGKDVSNILELKKYIAELIKFIYELEEHNK